MLTTILRPVEVALLRHAVVHIVRAVFAFPEAMWAVALVLRVASVSAPTIVKARGGGAVISHKFWVAELLELEVERTIVV